MYNKDNPQSIRTLFDSIANNYDRTNAILSFSLHKRWNKKLVQSTLKSQPKVFLDLCCGTGEIAFTYLANQKNRCHGHLLDFSEQMLACAKHKAEQKKLLQKHHLSFHQADAQAIPLPDASVEAATVAYGIRNVQNQLACFQEVYRVLKPGAVFGILELTRPHGWLKYGHQLYLKMAIPILGRLFANNKQAYSYLSSSISHFSEPSELAHNLRTVGFEGISIKPLTFGIATLIIANKKGNI